MLVLAGEVEVEAESRWSGYGDVPDEGTRNFRRGSTTLDFLAQALWLCRERMTARCTVPLQALAARSKTQH
ncbi:hypothetical protein CORC01_03153 [Colletotrichum orchidophilum]|uniref:Uncharacterized protein n=1 Tax=Colletotrichum orchidophilum TaxID=1209926 RepID=A0A1G4BK24_9PEZI|nr:uncharacterized protein CORC01_03153 [Colletotrichum orchidophilum]OHF01663.1 hypothetical protein CORC01_03153 [Colletotrichum orchidophilum]